MKKKNKSYSGKLKNLLNLLQGCTKYHLLQIKNFDKMGCELYNFDFKMCRYLIF
jgi:hypothetical protein